MYSIFLFDDISPRNTKETDKKLAGKLSNKKPSSSKGNSIKDKMDLIQLEIEKHLSFLFDVTEECRDETKFTNYISSFINQDIGAVDTETLGVDYRNDKIFGFSMYAGIDKSIYVPVLHRGFVTGQLCENQLDNSIIKRELERVRDSNVKLVFHNGKFDMHMIYHNFGVMLPCWWDTMIASRLLHSAEKDHSLKYQYSVKVKGQEDKSYNFKSLFDGVPAEMVPIKTMTPYAAGDTFETLALQKYQEEEFKKYPGIYRIFQLEMKVLPMIVQMEEDGVCIDMDVLKQMEQKYTAKLQQATAECYKELEKYQDAINRYNIQHPGKLSTPVKLSSPAQLAIIIYDIIGLAELPKYKRGTGKPVLAVFKEKNEFCNKLAGIKSVEKLVDGFIKALPAHITSEGKVHSDFIQVKGTGNTNEEDEESGADTGRFSCIAEGQYVQVVNGQKKIEDIEIGDMVYCYDDDGLIHLSKVTNKFDNGIRDCIEVRWQSTGTHKSGSLICTLDHRIRMKDGTWVQAKDLHRYNKLSHLRRGVGENGRPRIYGSNSFMDLEHNIIKRDYFNCKDSSKHIHHKDENKSNNSLDNLIILDDEKHTSNHAKEFIRRGVIDTKTFCSDKYRQKAIQKTKITTLNKISKEETIRLLLENNCSMSGCGYDYSTIKRRVDEYNIDLKELKEQLKGLDRENFTKVFFEEKGLSTKVAKRLHIGSDKANRYIEKYNLCYNHMVQIVKPVGMRHVYDLEVETYHNFIVSEICVHNCKMPNLQQIPSRGEGVELRKMFCASPGHMAFSSDYSQQEPRCLAECSKDEEMINAYKEGKDLYALMASKIYNTEYENCLEFYPEGTKIVVDGKEIICGKKEHTNKAGKKRRSATKAVLLG